MVCLLAVWPGYSDYILLSTLLFKSFLEANPMRIWFNKNLSAIFHILRLIKEADHNAEFDLIASHTIGHHPVASVADQFFTEPVNLRGLAYLDWCLNFCLQHKIEVFCPGKEATFLARHQNQFAERGCRLMLVADAEILALLDDKAAFCQATQTNPTPPAPFELFQTASEFETAYANMRPHHQRLCVKPAKSIYGLGFAVLDETRNSAQLLIAGEQHKVGLSDFRRGLAEMQSFAPMLLMNYLDGKEYSVDCVGDKGRLVVAIARQKSAQAGQGQVIHQHPQILQAVTQLCAQFHLSGLFNVQFKEHAGQPYLLEINARASGGVAMACLAGVNLPYLALKGFVDGFTGIQIAEVKHGLRVREINSPVAGGLVNE